YVPHFGGAVPTVLGLESGVRYHAYYWEPSLGIRLDLGAVERPHPESPLFNDSLVQPSAAWVVHGADAVPYRESSLLLAGDTAVVLKEHVKLNAVAAVDLHSEASGSLVLRYQGPDRYIAATYSPERHSLYVQEHRNGRDGPELGSIPIPTM